MYIKAINANFFISPNGLWTNLVKKLIIYLLISSPIFVASASRAAVDISRGKNLYSTFCTQCHASQIHIQKKQKVTDFVELKKTVKNRSLAIENLQWEESEINDVTYYLNERYYNFK